MFREIVHRLKFHSAGRSYFSVYLVGSLRELLEGLGYVETFLIRRLGLQKNITQELLRFSGYKDKGSDVHTFPERADSGVVKQPLPAS